MMVAICGAVPTEYSPPSASDPLTSSTRQRLKSGKARTPKRVISCTHLTDHFHKVDLHPSFPPPPRKHSNLKSCHQLSKLAARNTTKVTYSESDAELNGPKLNNTQPERFPQAVFLKLSSTLVRVTQPLHMMGNLRTSTHCAIVGRLFVNQGLHLQEEIVHCQLLSSVNKLCKKATKRD